MMVCRVHQWPVGEVMCGPVEEGQKVVVARWV